MTGVLLQPSYLQKRLDYSCTIIESLRQAMQCRIAPVVGQAPLTVVAVGSYGRCEVSSVSDIDYFVVHDGSLPAFRLDKALNEVGALIRPLSHPGESDNAKFGRSALSLFADLSDHIGWKREGSTALTRRMLLLLEGRPLFGDACYATWRNHLLRRYVPDDHGRGLARFMLNDLVRYYRTMMANFEEKKAEGKLWGVRNVKLRFSRKLLFMAGIVVIAEAHGLPAEAKIRRIEQLLALTPLQRMAALGYANVHSGTLFEHYADFLKLISSAKNRQHLDRLPPDGANSDPLYRELKALGEAFSENLELWLRWQYSGHPILHALFF